MELDTDRKLGEVLSTRKAFIDTMLEIQQCAVPRAEFSHWASHLRFIRTPRVDLTELGRFFAGPTVLDLTEKNDNPGETRYLAVSYCWDSFEYVNGREDHPRYNIRTNRGLRPSRTPTRVLDRSILYAILHDIRFIWIDQECIEQDNSLDLEHGVQCMDQVYRSAAYSIGLLNTEISSQSVFHTLTNLVSDERDRVARISSWENSWYNHSENWIHSEMADFLRNLSGDRWFYRNWTYQEASCTQDKIHLLIPVSTLVSSSNRCFNEVSVRLSELFFIASRVSAAKKPLRSPPLNHSSPPAMIGLCAQAWSQGRRLSCPQSYEVAGQMRYRDNSVVADRLAITANLCGYTRRLDFTTLIARKFSYSVCALALALLNGTIIPSGRTNIFSSTGKPLFRWQDETIYRFLISPEYLSTAYANPDRLESRLKNVTITQRGLETQGWLWKVDRKISLPWVKVKHQNFLEKLQNSTSMTSLSSQLYVFIQDLLHGFEQLNLRRIANTLYECVRIGQTKPSSYRQSTLDEHATDPYFPGHWLFRLIEKFLQTGHFWCGSLDGEEELSSIFDCEAPAIVFTGSDVEFNDIPRPWAAKNFISCEVIPVSESAESVKELMHTMEPVHGIWYGTEASSKKCIFPWGDF